MKAWMHLGLITLAIFISTSNSHALPEAEIKFGPGADGKSVQLSSSIKIPSSGANPGAGNGSGGNRKVGPFIRTSYRLPNTSSGCNPQGVTTIGTGEAQVIYGPPGDGQLYATDIQNRETQEVVMMIYHCVGPTDDDNIVPILPPSYEEIWQSLYSEIFNNVSSVSAAYVAPHSPGLTGLPTKIWTNFPDGQSISQNLNFPGGYNLQASAYISEVSIFVRDPKGNTKTLVRISPSGENEINGGNFTHPLLEHIFRTAGQHVITTAVTWSGRNAELSGGILPEPLNISIGEVRLELNREYEVNQLLPNLVR